MHFVFITFHQQALKYCEITTYSIKYTMTEMTGCIIYFCLPLLDNCVYNDFYFPGLFCSLVTNIYVLIYLSAQRLWDLSCFPDGVDRFPEGYSDLFKSRSQGNTTCWEIDSFKSAFTEIFMERRKFNFIPDRSNNLQIYFVHR